MTGHLEDVMEEMAEADAEEKRREERLRKEQEEQKRREEQKKVGRVSSRVQANALIEAEKARLEVIPVRMCVASTHRAPFAFRICEAVARFVANDCLKTDLLYLLVLAGDRSL